MPLELKQQRILPAKIGRTLYRYTIRPITREEWLAYFDSVSYEQRAEGDSVVSSIDNSAARIELLGKVLLNVEGYETEDEQPITDIANWRDILPIAHRGAFADLLFDCGVDPSAVAPVMLGAEMTVLRARWSEDVYTKGRLVEFSGLKHVFKVPSIEQHRRYSRDSTRSRIVGGRKGTTQFLGAQRTLAALYDELIVRVEGYTSDGYPLGEDRETIVANMDTFHKVQAMGAVFAPAEADAEE